MGSMDRLKNESWWNNCRDSWRSRLKIITSMWRDKESCIFGNMAMKIRIEIGRGVTVLREAAIVDADTKILS